jgi:GntR family transcriptional repressor for pyruvate dehydrogenase complex
VDVASSLRCQEVRIALESDAARLAAERHTPAQLQAIEAAHEAFAASVEAGRMDAEADLAFHRLIVEATGNKFYLNVLESIHDTQLGFMRLTLNLTRTASKHRAQRVLDEHVAALDAIRRRDAELARVSMQFHLSQARQRLIDRRRDS